MALRFAILTALAERGSTGSELARRFDRAFGYFWSASHQQIYRELDQLQAHGLVAETPRPARPRRGQPKHFEITPTGAAALRAWLAEVGEPTPPRHALAVRVRAAAAVGDVQGARAAIAHHLEVHERTYAVYQEIEARDFATTESDSDVLRHLVLKAGMELERAWVEWGREALKTLEHLPDRDTLS